MCNEKSDYCDAYIVVIEAIELLASGANENDKAEKDVAFKNNAWSMSCISKIDNTLIENAEVMPIYNLLEYTDNYSKTSGSLWNYYRDEIDGADDNAS